MTQIGKPSDNFLASLAEEDYENEGVLEMSQVKEIITDCYSTVD